MNYWSPTTRMSVVIERRFLFLHNTCNKQTIVKEVYRLSLDKAFFSLLFFIKKSISTYPIPLNGKYMTYRIFYISIFFTDIMHYFWRYKSPRYATVLSCWKYFNQCSGSGSIGFVCFWASRSGSISHKYGSWTGLGSFPFLMKVSSGLK